MTKRAAVYARQSKTRDEGIEDQLRRGRARIESSGWTFVENYVDNDVTASKPRGPKTAWGRMLADAEGIDVVVSTDMDRILRSTRDLNTLIDHDVMLTTLDGEIDLASADGEFRATMLAALARFETRRKGERQRRANEAQAARGRPYWRRRPFGWNLDGSLVPDEAQAIQEAATRLLEGWSLAAITREWNKAGHRTPKAGSMGGKEWTTQGVRRVLMAHRIAGIREYNGTETQGTWTPAVSEDIWRACRALLSNPARNTAKARTGKVAKSLLAGIATCGECGGLMHTDKSRGDQAYRCTEKRELLRKAAPIDAQVLTETARLLTLPGIAERVITDDSNAERSALLQERHALVQRRDIEIPGMVAIGLSVSQIAAAVQQVNERLDAIDSALEATTADASLWAVFEAAQTAQEARGAFEAEVWQGMPLEARRTVVRALWTVTVGKDGTTVEPTDVALRLAAQAGATDWYRIPTN